MDVDRPHPAAVAAVLAVVAAVAVALATSSWSGTGAADVGDTGPGPAAATAPAAAPGPGAACAPTRTNPGGDNNYRSGAPVLAALGRGFTVTGVVRDVRCAPLPGVRVQVWAQTAVAGEKENRASAVTDPAGRYRMETDRLEAQFGQLNIHVAYDDDAYEPVFVRHVVGRDATRAVVDLTLAPPE